MLVGMKYLEGITLQGQDGGIGKLKDFYFDDNRWTVRYLVVEAGEWLEEKRLLISPQAVSSLDLPKQVFLTGLDREALRAGPWGNADLPLRREDEAALHAHYQWPIYWGAASDIAPGAVGPALEQVRDRVTGTQPGKPEAGPALRSAGVVRGYSIQARDGEIGKVADFIIEDENWRIVYMIVDLGGLVGGKQVIVSPSWIERIDWENKRAFLDLKQETIQHSPEYDPSAPLGDEFITRLYDHYGKRRDV